MPFPCEILKFSLILPLGSNEINIRNGWDKFLKPFCYSLGEDVTRIHEINSSWK